MHTILPIFIILPFLGFLISVFVPKHDEKGLSVTAFCTAGLQSVFAILFVSTWLMNGFKAINIKEFVIYETEGYEYFIDLYFDKITAVFLMVGSFLTFLITVYSRRYLHREQGYKRFFNSILFFYFGYNIIIFSGNFETLFIGWEVLGISSFLLIAFYRNRYLPVRNAFKVFSVYRISDIAMILAMWMSHHLWHHNVTFLELNNYEMVDVELHRHYYMGIFISFMILISAAVKSAQFPFSSWLPRAMEGPTPSSAIFYSSLSVHIGVFMLLRTFPFWEHQIMFRWIVAALGLTTSILATYAGNVQSTIKSQVAYSSVAQIGLIFIEVACGFDTLALIHFAGNAFLRTYQLLVSPSVVTYLIREQFYNFQPRLDAPTSNWYAKFKNTIYVLSVREWNMDTNMFNYLWNPFKRFGRLTTFFKGALGVTVLLLIYGVGLYAVYQDTLSHELSHTLSVVFAMVALVVIIQAFTERNNAIRSLLLVAFSHCWIALSVSFNEHFSLSHSILYLSGVIVSSLIGVALLMRLRSKELKIDLNGFYGHVYEHKWLSFMFLLCCLSMSGFPITPTFIGEDVIYSHIHEDQMLLTVLVSITLIIAGLSSIRIYIRIFLGPHIKPYHPIAYRSS